VHPDHRAFNDHRRCYWPMPWRCAGGALVASACSSFLTTLRAGDNALLRVQSGNCSYRQVPTSDMAAVSFCMVAYRVTTAHSLMTFTPISTTMYNFSSPYGPADGSQQSL
jgi:hypothetical protein